MRRAAASILGIILLFTIPWLLYQLIHKHEPEEQPYASGVPADSGRVQPQIAIGYSVGTLLAPDGSLWVWGGTDAVDRQLIPSGRPTETPVLLGTNRNWLRIAMSCYGLAAIRSDGTMWFRGRQPDIGARGGNSTSVFPEQLVSDATNWISVAAGSTHFIALAGDGTVWTWGDNQFGQLGDDTPDSATQLVQVGAGTNWTSVAAGAYNSYGLQDDGTIWGWGMDLAYFQNTVRGNRTNNHMLAPQRLDEGTNWTAISAAGYTCAGLQSDGSIWVIGQGASGLIGQRSTTNYARFQRVGDEESWTSVQAGAVNLYATKADGSLWALGANHQGQLGDEVNTWSYNWLPFPDAWCLGAGQGTVGLLARDGTLWTQGVRLGAPMNPPSLIEQAGVWVVRNLSRRNVSAPSPTYRQDTRPHKIWDMPAKMKQELSGTNTLTQP